MKLSIEGRIFELKPEYLSRRRHAFTIMRSIRRVRTAVSLSSSGDNKTKPGHSGPRTERCHHIGVFGPPDSHVSQAVRRVVNAEIPFDQSVEAAMQPSRFGRNASHKTLT